MANEPITTVIDYNVASCPKCNKSHSFKLKGLAQQKAEAKVPMFGGTGEAVRRSEILFTCPDTKQKFTCLVPDPVGVEIIGPALEADIALVTNAAPAPLTINEGFEEWTKKSRDIALDFCKTMLSTSTGGIPVYFAVLKYVGFEKIGGTTLSKLGVLPPVLFLVAAILYVLALRPRYELVAPNDFNSFRKSRLDTLNQFIIGGTAIFIAAISLSIVILFYTLSK